MGGYDPYSSSKGCAELVTAAWQRSFARPGSGFRIASARAGNVIGGGDWARDRLIPDCIRAFNAGETVVVRRPDSVRPWQHVLEPLSGYLAYAEQLAGAGDVPANLNFGPSDADVRPVRDVVGGMVERWGEGASWRVEPDESLHEAGLLTLNSGLATSSLGWRPRWTFSQALDHTTEWYRYFREGNRMDDFTLRQIMAYEKSGTGE
jgi:CDP-glucose 4,6-dehydratase